MDNLLIWLTAYYSGLFGMSFFHHSTREHSPSVAECVYEITTAALWPIALPWYLMGILAVLIEDVRAKIWS